MLVSTFPVSIFAHLQTSWMQLSDACNHCPWDNNWIQFVADGCNCSVFYLCEKRNGVIVPHAQSCNPCFCFSNEKWTCVQFRNDSSCPTAPPPGTDPAVTGQSLYLLLRSKEVRSKKIPTGVWRAALCHSEVFEVSNCHVIGRRELSAFSWANTFI